MYLIHVIRDTLKELRCYGVLILCVNFSLEIVDWFRHIKSLFPISKSNLELCYRACQYLICLFTFF